MGRFREMLRIMRNRNPAEDSPSTTPVSSRPVTPQPANMIPRAKVIVPLYNYPLTEETWEPLHKAIEYNPDLQFVVVINPNSGPGEPPAPDARYSQELPKLNKQKNVTTVGYVRLQYCKRSLEQVYEDVAIYAGWAKDQASGIYVEGIFLDEAPNEWSDHVGKYLNDLSLKIKETQGILAHKLIIHNPGTIPDAELTKSRPEVTVVFEQSYARLKACGEGERRALATYDRKGCSYILHSVPKAQVRSVTHEARQRAEYIFVTDLSSKFYESFSPHWSDFIRAMVED